MNTPTLGIIGGGQLGSLLADAAKKIDIQTIILSDDPDAPGKHFATKFIFGQYDDDTTINNFINAVDLVTYEFENIPFTILKKINENKKVLPKPEINQLIQHRETEKKFLNDNNISVIIAGAGGSAHLPGMIASLTTIPVIGVPVESRKLKGLDSLLSIVQMPKGIPVGSVAIGEDGAMNAGLYAASIIALTNKEIKKNLKNYRTKQSKAVKQKP